MATREIEVDRFGVFGVGAALDPNGKIIEGLWTIYHLPSGLMIVPWACTNRDHMLREARVLRGAQYHARAWTSNDMRRLVADRRVRDEVARMLASLYQCHTCGPLVPQTEQEMIDNGVS